MAPYAKWWFVSYRRSYGSGNDKHFGSRNTLAELAASSVHKVEAALKSELGGDFQTYIGNDKKSAITQIEYADLFEFRKKELMEADVKSVMLLKIIECAIFLHPKDAGTCILFQQWVNENKNDIVTLSCGYLFASSLI